MKKTILILLCFSFFLSSCKPEKTGEENFTVVATFYPIYLLAINIADGVDGVSVQNLTAGNTGCPDEYQLTTAAAKTLSHADLILSAGMGSETFLDRIAADKTVIDTSEGVTPMLCEDGEENPHYWLSLSAVSAGVQTIADALAEADEKNAGIYRQNAEKFTQSLLDLENEFKTSFEEKNVRAASFHEAFSYFQRDFAFLILESEHENLSPKNLSDIIRRMKEEEIPLIFADRETLSSAEIVAAETGAVICVLDPIENGAEGKDVYLSVMRTNLEKIRDAS